jgi:hypothetical protein
MELSTSTHRSWNSIAPSATLDLSDNAMQVVSDALSDVKVTVDEEQLEDEENEFGGYKWWHIMGFWHRCKTGALSSLMQGEDICIGDVDEIFSTLALVNILALTIPFSVVMEFNPSYWSAMREMTQNCSTKTDSYNLATYDYIFSNFRNTITLLSFASATTVLITIFYYLLRPRQCIRKFGRWWHRSGKILFLLNVGGTTITMVSVMFLTSILMRWHFLEEGQICDNPNGPFYRAGYFLLLVILAGIVYIGM